MSRSRNETVDESGAERRSSTGGPKEPKVGSYRACGGATFAICSIRLRNTPAEAVLINKKVESG